MRASGRLVWQVAVRRSPVSGWAGGVYLVVEARSFGGGGGGGPAGEREGLCRGKELKRCPDRWG